MNTKASINSLFILRFIGAVVVVVHHYGMSMVPESGFWQGFFGNGGFVLSFFFVLSGYVIGYNYFDVSGYSSRDFLIKRFSRALPIYLIAFIVTLLSSIFLGIGNPKGISIIAQALGVHGILGEFLK